MGTDNVENRDPNEVWFVSNIRSAPGTAHEHRGKAADVVKRTLDEVRMDWEIVTKQVVAILGATYQKPDDSGFQLDEAVVKLGFSAKGRVAFVAEAGAELSIELTFKRKS